MFGTSGDPSVTVSISTPSPLSRYPIDAAKKKYNQTAPLRAAAIIGIAICIIAVDRSSIFDHRPLEHGAIPAAKRQPHEHWSYMANDASFVRAMTVALVQLAEKSKEANVERNELPKNRENTGFPRKAGFDGSDVHVDVARNSHDMTHCSTTLSAITAYFCGASVAIRRDSNHNKQGGMFSFNLGTRSFRNYLTCRRRQGLRDGAHRRSLYRLGIFAKNEKSTALPAGYSHSFVIAAQPDGTYHWLQSSVRKYLLSTWMRKDDRTKKSGLAGHLTYDELMYKLDGIDRLTSIDGWTPRANADYFDLFNVDKYFDKRGRVKEWTLDHRLDRFVWDEACEYPMYDVDQARGNQATGQNAVEEEKIVPAFTSDNCTIVLAISRVL